MASMTSAATVLATALAAGADVNLVNNGGFESIREPGQPAHWIHVGSFGEAMLTDDSPRTGKMTAGTLDFDDIAMQPAPFLGGFTALEWAQSSKATVLRDMGQVYRHSDSGTLILQVGGADMVNYPSEAGQIAGRASTTSRVRATGATRSAGRAVGETVPSHDSATSSTGPAGHEGLAPELLGAFVPGRVVGELAGYGFEDAGPAVVRGMAHVSRPPASRGHDDDTGLESFPAQFRHACDESSASGRHQRSQRFVLIGADGPTAIMPASMNALPRPEPLVSGRIYQCAMVRSVPFEPPCITTARATGCLPV